MRPSSNMLRLLALAALLAALAGCSEYLDRRDTISLSGGNSVATNKVTQMVDPWPRASADRNIAFNGDEDGNRGRALSHQPRDPAAAASARRPATSRSGSNSQNNTTPVGPTVTQSAAPVK